MTPRDMIGIFSIGFMHTNMREMIHRISIKLSPKQFVLPCLDAGVIEVFLCSSPAISRRNYSSGKVS